MSECKNIEGQLCKEVLLFIIFFRWRKAQKLLFHLALSDREVRVLEGRRLHATSGKLDCVASIHIVAPFHVASGLFEIVIDTINYGLIGRIIPGVYCCLELPQRGGLIPRS